MRKSRSRVLRVAPLIILFSACHTPRTSPATAEQEVRRAEPEWVNVTLKQAPTRSPASSTTSGSV